MRKSYISFALIILVLVVYILISRNADRNEGQSDAGTYGQETVQEADESGETSQDIAVIETGAAEAEESDKAEESAAAEENAEPVYYFRNQNLLNSHYEKHGMDMGFASAAEYEAAASAVITNPAALFKTEKEDGDYVYYVEATNEFVVLSTDGYIRTYFLPASGKSYFDRQ